METETNNQDGRPTEVGPTRTADRDAALCILSYGMGVESQAILERWLHEPDTRPFTRWDQLIVVTAQVGEEHKSDTVKHVEARTLPLLRRFGIRFVEVARRGLLKVDGIVVLQDTRCPERLNPDGVFKLSDELLLNGTVPQYGSTEHRCAMKFKAFVIEAWMAHALRADGDTPVVHAFGYNAGEVSRINDSNRQIGRHNDRRNIDAPKAPLLVFGFNSEEIGRIERNKQYDGPNRIGHYPLLEWNWTRERCHAYILERSAIDWKKSHCSFCPFNADCSKGAAAAVARWYAAPEQTAHGLIVEYNALCFNPRGTLYKGTSLIENVRKANVQPVIDVFNRRLAAMQWGFYRVRRIYTGKGKAMRCVERVGQGTRDEMLHRFSDAAGDYSVRVVEHRGIRYAMFSQRQEQTYPTREGFYVVAPLFVENKVRGPIERFNERWERVGRGLAINGEAIDPKQTDLALADPMAA